MSPELSKQINQLVNSLETITYNKHHYVRKNGLKRKIKRLLDESWITEDVLKAADEAFGGK